MDTKGKVFWGLSKTLHSGTASRISVLGEKKETGYIKYSDDYNIKEIFPPEGKVFCPSSSDFSYCTFQAELYTNKAKADGDEYITLPDQPKELRAKNLLRKKSLEQSLPLEELQELDSNLKDGVYYINIENTKELVGPFTRNQRGIAPQTHKEAIVYDVSSDPLLQDLVFIDHDSFLNSPDIYPQKRKIDCMSDEQLKDWFRTKLKEAKGFPTEEMKSMETMMKVLKSKLLPNAVDLDRDRYRRIKKNLEQFVFSYGELQDVLVGDGFAKISEKIDKMRLEIKQEYESQLHDELKNLHEEKSALENKRDSISAQLNELKSLEREY